MDTNTKKSNKCRSVLGRLDKIIGRCGEVVGLFLTCLTILNVNLFFKVSSCTGNLCNATNCDSNPCKNGATCLDHISSFSCVCKPGLTGRLCELHPNRCESIPCQNGGTCTNGVDAFTCTCARGFNGETCEKRTGDCTDPPSIVNGIVRLRNSYGFYKCNRGYKTIGIRVIKCVNGKWIGKPPTCQLGEQFKIAMILTYMTGFMKTVPVLCAKSSICTLILRPLKALKSLQAMKKTIK